MSGHDNKRKRSREDSLVDLLKMSLALKHFKAYKQELEEIHETEEELRSDLNYVLALDVKEPVCCIICVFLVFRGIINDAPETKLLNRHRRRPPNSWHREGTYLFRPFKSN
jgi:hypothetical protein